MDIDRAIRYWGKTLLVVEALWTLTWLVTGLIEVTTDTPLPAVLFPGLPLAAYDSVTEYTIAHIGISLHFLLAGSIFLLATATGSGFIVGWYVLPLGAVISKDLYGVVARYSRLSRVAHPEFFVMEATLAVSALSISITAFVWFQFVYWRYRLTGHRFDVPTEATGEGKKYVKPAPVRQTIFSSQGQVKVLL
jgi:hypothetical protein